MKKKISIIVILVIVIVAGIYQYTILQERNNFKSDIISFLENKGYDYKAEIEEVELVCFSKKCDILAAVVNFKDEPTVDYLYAYKINTKQIQQIDVYNTVINQPPKHKEK